jgi:simple sugar transport system substrate-binding protein
LQTGEAPREKKIVLGFAQIGDESQWRTANSESIKSAAKEAGIELIFSDAQQKQENQIKAIRSFIAQQVDVIAFSPVVETGWDMLLQEARDAGIPVIITDRAIKTEDLSLYVTYLGSDFVEEGRKAGRWLVDSFKDRKEAVNIVELEGNSGASPTIGRKKGFEEIVRQDSKYRIVSSQTGDFMHSKGKEIMEDILKSGGPKVDVVYSHNDDMALGAIEAIEECGLKPGKDIVIISVDAIRDAFKAMADGKLNCTVECNPLLGPILMKTVKDIVGGKQVSKRIVTGESIFPAETAREEMLKRKY